VSHAIEENDAPLADRLQVLTTAVEQAQAVERALLLSADGRREAASEGGGGGGEGEGGGGGEGEDSGVVDKASLLHVLFEQCTDTDGKRRGQHAVEYHMPTAAVVVSGWGSAR
jgi:hypothetical protein